MPDYSASIKEIASSLAVIAEANDSPLNTVVTIVTTLFSVGAGWLVGWLPARSAERKKRTLIQALLYDEVTLRWQSHMKKDLEKLSSLTGLAFVETLAGASIHESDLRIVKVVADSFADLPMIGDTKFVSSVVYCSVLMQDLTAAPVLAHRLLEEYRSQEEALRKAGLASPVFEQQLDRLFSARIAAAQTGLLRIFNELDKELESLLPVVRPTWRQRSLGATTSSTAPTAESGR